MQCNEARALSSILYRICITFAAAFVSPALASVPSEAASGTLYVSYGRTIVVLIAGLTQRFSNNLIRVASNAMIAKNAYSNNTKVKVVSVF